MDKRNYATRFNFETGHQSLPLSQALNIPGYFGLPEIPFMEVAFVHSPEEAAGFPRDVFVAWPGSGTDEALESFIDEVITMRYTGQNLHGKQVSIPEELSLPTTVEDLVDNWEMAMELLLILRQLPRVTWSGEDIPEVSEPTNLEE